MLAIAALQRFVIPPHTLQHPAAPNPYPRQIAFVWVDSPMRVMPYGSLGGKGVDSLMLCERFAGTPRIGEPHKADLVDWFALDALLHTVMPFLDAAIACWREGRWFHEFGFPVPVSPQAP